MPDSGKGASWVFPAAVALTAALGTFYAFRSPVVQQRQALALRQERLATEVAALWERSAELERTRDALMYDAIMVESVARAQMGYRRHGEIVHAPAPPLVASLRPRREAPASVVAPEQEVAKSLPDAKVENRSGTLLSAISGALLPVMALLAAGAFLFWLVAEIPAGNPANDSDERG